MKKHEVIPGVQDTIDCLKMELSEARELVKLLTKQLKIVDSIHDKSLGSAFARIDVRRIAIDRA